eukprot:5834892-Pyramimonas_sp.AAC.3
MRSLSRPPASEREWMCCKRRCQLLSPTSPYATPYRLPRPPSYLTLALMSHVPPAGAGGLGHDGRVEAQVVLLRHRGRAPARGARGTALGSNDRRDKVNGVNGGGVGWGGQGEWIGTGLECRADDKGREVPHYNTHN